MTNISCTLINDVFYMPFTSGGEALPDSPRCGMTTRAAGSMRYRIAETNERRLDVLGRIADKGRDGRLFVTEAEQTHSKIVIDAKTAEDAFMRYADGIITVNQRLLPVVTAADCVPIFLYDSITGVFGVVHSGWKGTGIAAEAIHAAETDYGSEAGNMMAVIGPHIHSECYTVDEDRARQFSSEYGADCVEIKDVAAGREYHLSLLKANVCVLLCAGVKEENIAVAEECTCCNDAFGSFRRETGGREGVPFTVQAAFCGYFA